jgi:predicted transposase/invertase (TIGR01784 family)
VRTDAIFYQLFKRFPSFLFTLLETPPAQAKDYRFESVEIKETAFRIDGVFLPPETASPKIIYFAEVQFQSDEALYHRFFTESLLYLFRNQAQYDDWQGIILFAKRSLEPQDTTTHRALLNSDQIQRIYLDELETNTQQPIGIQLMQLVIAPENQTAAQAKQLIQQVQAQQTQTQQTVPFAKQDIIELITTITVYKFTHLSRQEVEAMIGVSLEETRVYQEAKADGKAEGLAEGAAKGKVEGKAEGKAEGQLEEGRSLILRQLSRRVGDLTPALRSQVEALSLPQLESLGEALLDFTRVEDLEQWLRSVLTIL